MMRNHRVFTRETAFAWALAFVVFTATGCGSGSGERAYVTVFDDNEVVAIDTQTHEIVDHISVGEGPAIILDAPGQGKLYTANWVDNTVSAIDVGTKDVTNIQMQTQPWVIAMGPDGERVYAGTTENPAVGGGSIAVIDTSTDEITRVIDMEIFPASLIVSPDGETLYTATLPGNTTAALDAETGEIIHEQIPVGNIPAWMTIHPDGSEIYTLNFFSDDVTVVDTQSWSVTATVDTGEGSRAIIGNVTPDGSTLYVTNFGTGEVMGIDTESHEVVDTLPVDGRPVGVEFTPDGETMYVTDFGPQSLERSADQFSSIILSGMFEPQGNGQVRAFDLETGEQVGDVVEVGPGPTSVVIR